MKEVEMFWFGLVWCFFLVPNRDKEVCFSSFSLPGSWLVKMCQATELKWFYGKGGA